MASIVYLLRPFSGSAEKIFWDVYPMLLQLLAVAAVASSLKTFGSRRPGWLLIGAALAIHLIGDATWAYQDIVLANDPSKLRWIDIMYVASFAGLVAGTLVMIRTEPRRQFGRILLDGLVVCGSLGLLTWDLWLRNAWNLPTVAGTDALVFIYPIADLCLAASAICMLQTSRRNGPTPTHAYLWFTAACVLACADTAYSVDVVTSSHEVGLLPDLLWAIGIGLGAWACFEARWSDRDVAEPPMEVEKPTPSWVVTFGLVAVAPLAVVFDLVLNLALGLPTSAATLLVGLVLLILVALRQVVVTLIQHKESEARLRLFNLELESTVQDRTEKLAGLLRLASSVNGTLSVEEVLDQAAEQVHATGVGDGVIVWRTDTAVRNDVESRTATQFSAKGAAIAAIWELRARLESDQSTVIDIGKTGLEGRVLTMPLCGVGDRIGRLAIYRRDGVFDPDVLQSVAAMNLLIGPALEHAVAFERMAESVNLDPVTGLHNHRSLHQALHALFDEAKEKGSRLSILMMDLVNFRMFNSTYGHQVGDKVLNCVASILKDDCPRDGVVARFGGDEFVVVLPECGINQATEAAERFNERLNSVGFQFSDQDRAIPLSVCTGVACFPEDCDTYEELLAVAGRNLTSARIGAGGVACTTELQRSVRELRQDPTYETLDMLIAAVDNKDSYTRRHGEDVAEYALLTAAELGCTEEALDVIRTAGLLHDVGKIGVPPEILAKPARLSPDEVAIINRHAWIGAMIVSAFPGLEKLADVIRCHHERWDGKGYPDGRAGEDIPWISRLLAVADTFSAMTTDRPYRRALPWNEAVDEIVRQAGSQFDPALAEAFATAVRRHMARHLGTDDRAESRPAA